MTILNDIKSFIVLNQICQNSDIAFNFDDFNFANNVVILSYKGGKYNDIARNSTVSFTIKNSSMQTAETLCNSIFGLFCPPKQYEKPISVNGKLMLIKPAVLPTYKEKEKNGRHVFTFDLNFIHS